MDSEFQPDIKRAVRELVYLIEKEEAMPNGGNRETVAAARIALKALIGSKRLDKAREYLGS